MIIKEGKIKLGDYEFIDNSVIEPSMIGKMEDACNFRITNFKNILNAIVPSGELRARYMVEQEPHPDLKLIEHKGACSCFTGDILICQHGLAEMGKVGQMRHYISPSGSMDYYKKELVESILLFRDYCFDSDLLETLIVTAPIEDSGAINFHRVWCNLIHDDSLWDKTEKVSTPYGAILLLYQFKSNYFPGRNHKRFASYLL